KNGKRSGRKRSGVKIDRAWSHRDALALLDPELLRFIRLDRHLYYVGATLVSPSFLCRATKGDTSVAPAADHSSFKMDPSSPSTCAVSLDRSETAPSAPARAVADRRRSAPCRS